MKYLVVIKLIFIALIVYALYHTYMPKKVKSAVSVKIQKCKDFFKKYIDKVKGWF